MNTNDRARTLTTPDGRPEREQPRWRHDFPIDWTQDDFVSRRDFTRFLVLTSLAFVCGQIWILLQSVFGRRAGAKAARQIARVDAIPVGGAMVFDYPAEHDNCLLVRTGPETFVAYGQKCTHLSCPVKPDVEAGALLCPCHHGAFDLATGRPTAGPPRRPLPLVELRVERGVVYATGITERTS